MRMEAPRLGSAADALGSFTTSFGGRERLSRFVAAASAVSSAENIDEVLKRIVHAARSLAAADYATISRLEAGAEACPVFAGHRIQGVATSLERELLVGGEPYAVLRVATTRSRFTSDEQALVALLCIHGGILLERLLLRSHQEMLRRVQAVLGEPATAGRADSTVREVGDLRISLATHQAFVAGAPVHLTPSEFRLLELLTEECGRVYTRRDIVARLWDTGYAGSLRVADAHVARLRRKIERDPLQPERLVSVRGVGYKLVPDPLPLPASALGPAAGRGEARSNARLDRRARPRRARRPRTGNVLYLTSARASTHQ